MTKEVMRRQASDNEYLHKDFHGALSAGIDYLHQHYGEQAVREYLRQFTNVFYAPLKNEIKKRGLEALQEYFVKIYGIEGGEINIEISENEIKLSIEACPAVTHMRKQGYAVSSLFYETTKTVNETICEGTDFTAELVEYDEQTGRSIQKFRRRLS